MEIYNLFENEDWLIYVFMADSIVFGIQCKIKMWRLLFKKQEKKLFLVLHNLTLDLSRCF